VAITRPVRRLRHLPFGVTAASAGNISLVPLRLYAKVKHVVLGMPLWVTRGAILIVTFRSDAPQGPSRLRTTPTNHMKQIVASVVIWSRTSASRPVLGAA
jgi:hypothetical protein